MTDDVKAALELWRETTAKPCRCLDCEAARTLLAHIDGEAARTAEAVARAREETREACARQIEALAPDADATPLYVCDVRATPLDATPLADELRAVKAERDRFAHETAELRSSVGTLKAHLSAAMKRAEKAEARVAELKLELGARVDRLSAQVVTLAQQREELRRRIHDACPSPDEGGRIHAGGRIVCGQCHDSEVQHLRNELARLTSEVPGLSPGPAYTAADVDAIERHRGRPYERLRATVAKADEAVRALCGLAAKYDPRASRSGGASYIADADASAEWRVVVDLLAKYPEGT